MKEPPGSPCTWTWTAEAHSPSRSPQHQHWYPYGKVTGRNSVPFCSALDPSPLQAANLTRQQVRLQEGAFVSYRMESPTVTTGPFLVLSHGSGLTSSDTCCSPPHLLPGHWTYSVQICSWRRTCPSAIWSHKPPAFTTMGAFICCPDEYRFLCATRSPGSCFCDDCVLSGSSQTVSHHP